jgi:hypothetical protein
MTARSIHGLADCLRIGYLQGSFERIITPANSRNARRPVLDDQRRAGR